MGAGRENTRVDGRACNKHKALQCNLSVYEDIFKILDRVENVFFFFLHSSDLKSASGLSYLLFAICVLLRAFPLLMALQEVRRNLCKGSANFHLNSCHPGVPIIRLPITSCSSDNCKISSSLSVQVTTIK